MIVEAKPLHKKRKRLLKQKSSKDIRNSNVEAIKVSELHSGQKWEPSKKFTQCTNDGVSICKIGMKIYPTDQWDPNKL